MQVPLLWDKQNDQLKKIVNLQINKTCVTGCAPSSTLGLSAYSWDTSTGPLLQREPPPKVCHSREAVPNESL